MPLHSEDDNMRTEYRILFEELSYGHDSLSTESQFMLSQLTKKQRIVYEAMISNVNASNRGLFFVYGYGGTGKTFMWRVLSSVLRSKGEIVINVASNDIASLLLPGGQTAHSRFAILISLYEDSTCNIEQGSQLTELIIKAKLIIWDETPMMHGHCFEVLDRTMRDLLHFVSEESAYKTFGRKTVVFEGDFRQTILVMPKGSRQDIVSTSINSSYLWGNCRVLRLTKNLCFNMVEPDASLDKLQQFANWPASTGDGTLGRDNDGYNEVDIPIEILLSSTGDTIATIVESTFPMFIKGNNNHSCFESRVIMAPMLNVVNEINEYMNDLDTTEGRT